MLAESNPLGCGWEEIDPSVSLADVLACISVGHGLYHPVEAPACGAVEIVPAGDTTDGVARTFICDRPAGHDGRHRHIHTTETEMVDAGSDADPWWAACWWPQLEKIRP